MLKLKATEFSGKTDGQFTLSQGHSVSKLLSWEAWSWELDLPTVLRSLVTFKI